MATDQVQHSPGGLLDLESELTCSICTEILFQPLTLLDCLHTFCGSCLKEWFGWQQVRKDQDEARSHRRRKRHTFTCPSCRTPVRDTRPNATVTTLLEMYIKANPARVKSDADKQELSKVYKHGDKVLPVHEEPPEEEVGRRHRDRRRHEREQEEDAEEIEYNRLMENAMAQSMEETLRGGTPRQRNRGLATEGSTSNGRYDVRRQRRSDEAADNSQSVQDMHDFDERPGNSLPVSPLRRNATAARSLRLGHQSSLRSLLSSSEVDSHEMEEEIMRQIQDEGLLDGIDLENIQVEQEDEISERIAQAYRRRRRARSRQNRDRPRDIVHHVDQFLDGSTTRREDLFHQHPAIPATQSVDHATSVMRPQHLSPVDAVSHRQPNSRNASRDQQSRTSSVGPRPASRSVTDMTNRPHSREADQARARRLSGQRRRSTEPHQEPPSELWRRAAREDHTAGATAADPTPANESSTQSGDGDPLSIRTVDGLTEQMRSPSAVAPQLADSKSLSIACNRCGIQHIEHDLHYSCVDCARHQGLDSFNICYRCYFSGQGCLNWYGFGSTALDKYHRKRATISSAEPPHYFSARRYLSSGDIEQGMFCSLCQQLTNDCFWRCGSCNDGEWGYCNTCIMQARHCTHPLTPYVVESYMAPLATTYDPDQRFLRCLRDLVPYCDVCHQPVTNRTSIPSIYVHCPTCNEGDYDVCSPCYEMLVASRSIPESNGLHGWRKCLEGHRMLLVRVGGDEVPSVRQVIADVVRGWTAEFYKTPADNVHGDSLPRQWHWRDEQDGSIVVKENQPSHSHEPPAKHGDKRISYSSADNAPGQIVLALWTRLPDEGATDELCFPRGAVITEAVNINEDWSYGVYCRQKGLFPAPYVREV